MAQNTNTNTTATQDQIIGAIRTSQEATVEAYKSWAKTFTTVTPSLFEAVPPKFDNFFGFAEKLYTAQKDFSLGLFEAAAEMSKDLPDTAKRATAAAENARSAASK
ncbi:MAG: hypothetical protein ACR2LJ_00240 [Acidimicrobiales bacterium]